MSAHIVREGWRAGRIEYLLLNALPTFALFLFITIIRRVVGIPITSGSEVAATLIGLDIAIAMSSLSNTVTVGSATIKATQAALILILFGLVAVAVGLAVERHVAQYSFEQKAQEMGIMGGQNATASNPFVFVVGSWMVIATMQGVGNVQVVRGILGV